MVHRPRRAGPDAPQAIIAEFRVDDVVPLVTYGLGGAAGLTCVAPDAGFRIDQMLPERRLRAYVRLHSRLHNRAGSPSLALPARAFCWTLASRLMSQVVI